jgi:outer membrane protein TolC
MRWKAMVMSLALTFAASIGCKQQCFVTECDLDHYKHLGLPLCPEADPRISIVPSTTNVGQPTTVDDAEREGRPLSLAEAIALALEHGTPGDPFVRGFTNDNMLNFANNNVTSPEFNIRVLSIDPARVATDIEASLAKFDAEWVTRMTWNTTDQPVASGAEAVVAAGKVTALQSEMASFNTGLVKPLPTGGIAGISFETDYDLTNAPTARVNPSYRPTLQFQFEQPLLQGFGVEINELRNQHPDSVLGLFRETSRVEGILITRLRFDQQRAEFERNVHLELANVEVAYWNLYAAYGELYAREVGYRLAYELWRINRRRYELGQIKPQDLEFSRAQWEFFRGQRLTALGNVLEAEHQLRGLCGLPVEDCARLVPVDQPTLAGYQPDWCGAVNEALALRPELVLARDDLKGRQLDVINQKNLLLPDVRFFSTYDLNGIGTHLDGGPNDPNNALHSLASDKFNNWLMGLRATVPIGYRDAHAALRSARLLLARSYAVLRDQENKAQRLLTEQYRDIFRQYALIQAHRAEREALVRDVQARLRAYQEGKENLVQLVLISERQLSDALTTEYRAIGDYNAALARFDWAKGTILQRDNVVISEGPLPGCAQVRAVEHERQRSQALVLREREDPVLSSQCTCQGVACGTLPQLPSNEAPSIPALFEGQRQLEAVPNALPATPSIGPETPVLPSPRPAGPSVAPPALPVQQLPAPTALKSATPAVPEGTPDPGAPVHTGYATSEGAGKKVTWTFANEMAQPTAPVAPARASREGTITVDGGEKRVTILRSGSQASPTPAPAKAPVVPPAAVTGAHQGIMQMGDREKPVTWTVLPAAGKDGEARPSTSTGTASGTTPP